MSEQVKLDEYEFLIDRTFNDFRLGLENIVTSVANLAARQIKDGEYTTATELAQRCQLLKDFVEDLPNLEKRVYAAFHGVDGSAGKVKSIAMRSASNEDVINRRRPSEALRVQFPDGHVIQGVSSAQTMAFTLQRFGFERVEQLQESVAGVPLVSREAHPKLLENYFNHQEVEGWFIATHIPNDRKVVLLRRIATRLAEQIEITTES